MKSALLIAQVLVSVSLIIVILLQAKGSGLGTAFGGESSFYRSKRGVEKLFVYLTIILAGLFLILSIAQIFIS